MKRLTEHHFKQEDGFYMKCSEHCCKEDFSCEDCMEFDKIVDRLGAIEDILGDDYDLDRLRELVEADRDGRCVVLPCKAGDFAYDITYGVVRKIGTVYSFTYNKKCDGSCVLIEVHTEDKKCVWVSEQEVGVSAFFSIQEANQALKNGTDKPENKHFLQRFMEVK